MRRTLVLAVSLLTVLFACPIPGLAKGTVVAPTVAVPAGYPKQLVIQRIKVSAPVEALDLRNPKYSGAPLKWGDVVWYDEGPKPGDTGRANIFGHFDSTCCAAVFFNLRFLKAGDTVQVDYSKGKPLTFRVLWSGMYANSKMPMKFLYGATQEHGLVLVTCAGHFSPKSGYDHKLVVYARLILPNGKLG